MTGRGADQLRCSHCRHLLGIRVNGKAVALGEDIGAIGDLLAIACNQTFANGQKCRGGWFDLNRLPELERVFELAPALRVAFGAPEPTPEPGTPPVLAATA